MDQRERPALGDEPPLKKAKKEGKSKKKREKRKANGKKPSTSLAKREDRRKDKNSAALIRTLEGVDRLPCAGDAGSADLQSALHWDHLPIGHLGVGDVEKFMRFNRRFLLVGMNPSYLDKNHMPSASSDGDSISELGRSALAEVIGPGVGDKFWKLYDVCMSSCKNYFVNTGVHPYYKKLNPLLDAIGLSWEESSAIGKYTEKTTGKFIETYRESLRLRLIDLQPSIIFYSLSNNKLRYAGFSDAGWTELKEFSGLGQKTISYAWHKYLYKMPDNTIGAWTALALKAAPNNFVLGNFGKDQIAQLGETILRLEKEKSSSIKVVSKIQLDLSIVDQYSDIVVPLPRPKKTEK